MGRQVKVLIVDDGVGMIETLRDVLEAEGYGVSVTTDGHQAIQMAQEQPFHCILMDMKMPGLNGVEVFRKIRALAPQTVVVMMTAYSFPQLIEEAQREGALAVLSKPLHLGKVLSFLEGFKDSWPVLIVDDNRDFCQALHTFLKSKGYRTALAYDGHQAIDLFATSRYEIVLLDMRLPPTNGLEVLTVTKRLNPKVAVILMTAYGTEMREQVEEALRRKACLCLHKPFDPQVLLKILEEARRCQLRQPLL